MYVLDAVILMHALDAEIFMHTLDAAAFLQIVGYIYIYIYIYIHIQQQQSSWVSDRSCKMTGSSFLDEKESEVLVIKRWPCKPCKARQNATGPKMKDPSKQHRRRGIGKRAPHGQSKSKTSRGQSSSQKGNVSVYNSVSSSSGLGHSLRVTRTVCPPTLA